MKNSKLMKVILVGILSLMLVFVATQVFADDDGFTDLTGSISNTSTNTNDSSANNTTNNVTSNTLTNNTTTNSTTDGLTVNNTTNSTSNLTYNTSNNMSSSYNNTNLPSTGLGETTSVIFIIAVLAISAIYAYKKVSDYRNI